MRRTKRAFAKFSLLPTSYFSTLQGGNRSREAMEAVEPEIKTSLSASKVHEDL